MGKLKMTFKSFISLESNKEALNKALDKTKEILVWSRQHRTKSTRVLPLIISSERPGLGTTHLLQAIEADLDKMNVLSIYPFELFRSADLASSFCDSFKDADVLVVENLESLITHYCEGQQRRENAIRCFIEIIDSYYQQGKPILISMCELYSDTLTTIFTKLPYLNKSKVLISQLEYREKVILLKQWRKSYGADLFTDSELIEYAERDFDDVRSLEGIVLRLMAKRRKLRKEMD